VTARFGSPEALGDLTSEQVARLDASALDCGVTTLQLMEIAGWQVARCAWQHLGNRPGEISVVAGHGNNGGDGLVAARHLATWGCAVRVVVVADESRVGGLVRDHIVAARRCDVDVTVSGDPAMVHAVIAGARLVIDAILGTGLRSAPRELQAGAIRALNAGTAPILSVDVPSGLDATTGEAFDPCVRATLTCTLTAMKRGLWSEAGETHTGELWVADIGMPATAWERVGLRQPPGVSGGELVHTSSASPP
jgi:NAD(P)H-hydrate epimerase